MAKYIAIGGEHDFWIKFSQFFKKSSANHHIHGACTEDGLNGSLRYELVKFWTKSHKKRVFGPFDPKIRAQFVHQNRFKQINDWPKPYENMFITLILGAEFISDSFRTSNTRFRTQK